MISVTSVALSCAQFGTTGEYPPETLATRSAGSPNPGAVPAQCLNRVEREDTAREMSQENVELVRAGVMRPSTDETSTPHSLSQTTPSHSRSPRWKRAHFLEGQRGDSSGLGQPGRVSGRSRRSSRDPVGDASVVAVATWTGRGSGSGTPVGATAAQVFTIEGSA